MDELREQINKNIDASTQAALEAEERGEAPGKTPEGDIPIDLAQLLPDKMEEILILQVVQLREWAHIYMGLITHPKQKKVVVDIPQAKLAVDSASALVDIMLPSLSREQQREMKLLVSDLKMNFITKSPT